MRSAAAGSLRPEDVGRAVELAGWVARRRDHGGILFLDLRDATGVVQVVVDPESRAADEDVLHGLRVEYCITVTGTVRERPPGTENPDLATGGVEVAAEALTVLSPADPLPFQLDDRLEVSEEKRLRYRYLDLRRSRMAENLRARSLAIRVMRNTMEEGGFLEIETPTLVASTPEGARDVLVPSRLRPGTFYALPQSPQLFKQLLMISGVDRYYQIARCYRDEDFRSDRQIEFSQLDFEGAFWTEEDVLDVLETVSVNVTAALRGFEPPTPFPRLTWHEAMDRYGTDKPDLRFAMELVDLGAAVVGSDFGVFASTIAAGGAVRGINAGRLDLARAGLDRLTDRAKELGAKGLVWLVVEPDATLRSPIAKFLTAAEQAAIVDLLGAEDGDTLLIVADEVDVVRHVLGQLRVELGRPQGHDELSYLFVVDFPVFERDDEGNLTPLHHPFTAPADVAQMAADPDGAISRAYDLVLNGSELGSGSVRIHDPDVQAKVFEILGIGEEEAQSRFGWFLEALRYGTPPHAGFAIGIDRMVSILRDEPNIREVMPFPKTQTGADPLTGSPSRVTGEQLAELGIEISAAVLERWAAEAEDA